MKKVKKERLMEERRLELVVKNNKRLRKYGMLSLILGFVLALLGIQIGGLFIWLGFGLLLYTFASDFFVIHRKNKLKRLK
jgi:small-conductance mechanosensitive channel